MGDNYKKVNLLVRRRAGGHGDWLTLKYEVSGEHVREFDEMGKFKRCRRATSAERKAYEENEHGSEVPFGANFLGEKGNKPTTMARSYYPEPYGVPR